MLSDVFKVYSFQLELRNRSSQGIRALIHNCLHRTEPQDFQKFSVNFICRKFWESLCKLHCLRLLPRKRTPEMTYEPKIFILRWFDGQTVGWLTSDDLNAEVKHWPTVRTFLRFPKKITWSMTGTLLLRWVFKKLQTSCIAIWAAESVKNDPSSPVPRQVKATYKDFETYCPSLLRSSSEQGIHRLSGTPWFPMSPDRAKKPRVVV